MVNRGKHWLFTLSYKVGGVFLVVIWSEFRMGQDRDDDHREDAPHFTNFYSVVRITQGLIYTLSYASGNE